MNVLILGSGGRENAIAWKLKQSVLINDIFVAPGNPGTDLIAINLSVGVNDFDKIAETVKENKIDMLIVGPEDPLVNGITDYFRSKPDYSNLKIIGPSKDAAQLEGSKDFAKEFMNKYKIPTARYFTAKKDNFNQAVEFMGSLKPPYVLKADGLAAGKGVLIIENYDTALIELDNMLSGKFGDASSKVVIEEFLDGVELSVFAVTDGKDYVLLPEAKDYKRIGENNTGLNTGGMGAVSPVPFFNNEFKTKVIEKIVKPTIFGLESEKMDYVGFVFIGLINVNGEPYVIEYNVRMGDPETEVVLLRLKTDFAKILDAACNKNLQNIKVEFENDAAATVMIVSGGYPEEYEKNKEILGLDYNGQSVLFHAGTKKDGDKTLTNGGRVLAVSSLGKDIFSALNQSYKTIKNISFDKMNYRHDIGFDLK
ncbi:MAG: phosphoribosylamine--glycine ligase [Bacteroidales bacterium]|nr:phosphoribosylamine--glycine ligase [Bacteroidales bacterium]